MVSCLVVAARQTVELETAHAARQHAYLVQTRVPAVLQPKRHQSIAIGVDAEPWRPVAKRGGRIECGLQGGDLRFERIALGGWPGKARNGAPAAVEDDAANSGAAPFVMRCGRSVAKAAHPVARSGVAVDRENQASGGVEDLAAMHSVRLRQTLRAQAHAIGQADHVLSSLRFEHALRA